MAINYELLNKGGISLGTNFELLSEKPLDSRLVVPSLNGLQNYIDNAAAYEGMIVFDQTTKKTYQVQTINGVLSYREFGINEDELKKLIADETTAAMEFKGAATALPENPAKGDMYKVTEPFKVGEADTKVGDSIVYDGTQWFIIPSGDDIEDTWRPITGVNNDASLTFADGEKTVAAVAEDGTIKINHAKIADPEDVTAEGDEQTRTYLTAVVTDEYGHVTGYKTATENVEDTNTEYTFESQVESSNVYFNVTPDTEGATEQTIYVDAYSKNEVDDKLDTKLESVALDSPEVGKMRLTVDGEAQAAVEINGFTAVKETAESALQNAEGENAIAVNVTDNTAKVTLKLDNADTSRVELSQGANGLKVDVKGKLTDTTYIFADGTEDGTFLVTEEGKEAQKVKIGGETAAEVKKALIGENTDTDASDTIKGAKKYADKQLEAYTKTENLSDIAFANHTLKAEDVTDFKTEVAKVKVAEATKADQDGNGDNIAENYAKKATTLTGYGITDAYTKTEVDGAIEKAIDDIPDPIDYTVTITADTTDSTIAKRYIFSQKGQEIGRIDLAKELVVKSGSVKTVTTANDPYQGAIVGDKYIELIIHNQDEPIYIPAKDLVDIYDGVAGDRITVTVGADNKISADLVAGKIGKAYLDENVNASLTKAETALQAHQDISHLAVETDVENEFKKYTTTEDLTVLLNDKANKSETYTKTEVDKVVADAITAVLTWGEF